jgi:hypothetical protein
MAATVPFRPKDYLYSEDALLRIAKARHPDRWQPELLHPKEAEIYFGLGMRFNAQVLEYILREEISEADLDANRAIGWRLRDFEDAAYDLQIALHSGNIIAEYVDKRGEFGWIKPSGWGGDNAMSILLLGIVDLEDDVTGRRVLFKIESVDKLIATSARAAGKPEMPKLSEAAVGRAFKKWRDSRGENIPTQTEDFAHMRQLGVGRDRTMKLRQNFPSLPRGKPKAK